MIDPLRTEFNNIVEKVNNKFKELQAIKGYNFLKPIIDLNYDNSIEIHKLIEEKGVIEASNSYDFIDGTTTIYYNTESGKEVEANLLSIANISNKSNTIPTPRGIQVIDEGTNNIHFITFNQLNGLHYKLEVIETIQDYNNNI